MVPISLRQRLPEEDWFCTGDCKTIHEAIRKVVLAGDMQLQPSDLDLVRRKRSEKGLDTGAEPDLRWRLLSSNWTGEDCKLLLGKAVDIFHVSFHLFNFSLMEYCVSLVTIFWANNCSEVHLFWQGVLLTQKKKKEPPFFFLKLYFSFQYFVLTSILFVSRVPLLLLRIPRWKWTSFLKWSRGRDTVFSLLLFSSCGCYLFIAVQASLIQSHHSFTN